MQTNNSKPTPRVNEDAERFDEITGGYSDYEHDRAAKRINADLRKMPQRVEVQHADFVVHCKSLLRMIDGLPWHVRDAVYKEYNARTGGLPGSLPKPIAEARAAIARAAED